MRGCVFEVGGGRPKMRVEAKTDATERLLSASIFGRPGIHLWSRRTTKDGGKDRRARKRIQIAHVPSMSALARHDEHTSTIHTIKQAPPQEHARACEQRASTRSPPVPASSQHQPLSLSFSSHRRAHPFPQAIALPLARITLAAASQELQPPPPLAHSPPSSAPQLRSPTHIPPPPPPSPPPPPLAQRRAVCRERRRKGTARPAGEGEREEREDMLSEIASAAAAAATLQRLRGQAGGRLRSVWRVEGLWG